MSGTRFIAAAFFLLMDFLPLLALGGDLYKWKDEEGTVHVTDTLSQVPPQYRDQADRKALGTAHQKNLATREATATDGSDLKHFEVPYQAFEGTSRRIIVSVTFNDSVTARLLLDTGSPGLMISPELANRLGLLDRNGGGLNVMTGGIGGYVPAVLAVVDSVEVGEARSEFLPATITRIPSRDFEGLVGMDFMANYRIGIDTDNSVLHFDELPPQLERPGGHDEHWWRNNFQTFTRLRAEWSQYLEEIGTRGLSSSEKERQTEFAQNQYDQADQLCRKLERYARENAVPIQWRR